MNHIDQFDQEHADALRGIWFLGDIHAEYKHLANTLLYSEKAPNWLVFLGDIDDCFKPFRQSLEPLRRHFPGTKVAFIHGNHDADTYEHWEMLHDCGEAVALHGKVTDLDGVKVAGLGGNFMGRVWSPPPLSQNSCHPKNQRIIRVNVTRYEKKTLLKRDQRECTAQSQRAQRSALEGHSR